VAIRGALRFDQQKEEGKEKGQRKGKGVEKKLNKMKKTLAARTKKSLYGSHLSSTTKEKNI